MIHKAYKEYSYSKRATDTNKKEKNANMDVC